MINLWFYSGRIGNCMFQYAFTRCIADTLKLKCRIPKGTEIVGFPTIFNDSLHVNNHQENYDIYSSFKENVRDNNVISFIEPQFQGKKITQFNDNILIENIINTDNISEKYILVAGNFEIGSQYLIYRDLLKTWFAFPYIDKNKFEFFRIHPDFGQNNNYYIGHNENFSCITEPENLLISLRLEDYTNRLNKDRLLLYDYFKIILESRPWNKVYILTNPSSIGHNDEYQYIKEFYEYDPILIRCYDPVMSMALGCKFNHIAISQSTYSWWLAFLSNANYIYYPISLTGPFSLSDKNYICTDLRIKSEEFLYVDYQSRTILPTEFIDKIDYYNKSWTN
jgi:hypothetical protein